MSVSFNKDIEKEMSHIMQSLEHFPLNPQMFPNLWT